tara:strand:+ start:12 stop:227 length:216 start_codon:yes stop_codon:yes gene_type:complete
MVLIVSRVVVALLNSLTTMVIDKIRSGGYRLVASFNFNCHQTNQFRVFCEYEKYLFLAEINFPNWFIGFTL